MDKERLNQIGAIILDSAIAVHKELGPGLLESAYVAALSRELELREINVQRHGVLDMLYKGVRLEKIYVLDMLIENEIIIEAKVVDQLHPIHEAQLLIYLKIADKRLG